MQTVQGTSRFVSDNLVRPIVKAQSYTAGVRSAVQQLLMMNRKRSD